MFWLDWILVVIPLLIVVWVALKGQKYVRGVSDFLAAGRCAGRYVVSVAGAEAGMGLISVVAMVEMYYKSGFAISFWSKISVPLTNLSKNIKFLYILPSCLCFTVNATVDTVRFVG